ncbi:MAG: HEAT repeat domain-containing protein [Chloroflexi bacterium]|nr:HEAT repeat domain-containing protein [Chloroflexota bacterium]
MAVDKKLLNQLKDKDPKIRRKAIIALADCRDAAALKPLADIARSDPDARLRTLADRAQQHLNSQLNPDDTDNQTPRAAPPPRLNVSDRDIARGKAAMEEALSYNIAGDTAKATKSLIKAVSANPRLKEDSYFLSLAGNILSVPQDEALHVLYDSGKVSDYISSSNKARVQKKRDDHYSKTDELPWSAVWFDLGIFTAVTAVITFLLPLVFVQMIGRTIEYQLSLTSEELTQESLVISEELAEFYDAMNTVGLPIFLVVALATAASTAVSMLLQGGAIHLIATKLLHGTGTMRYMLCQILPYYSMTSLVLFVWLCIAMGLIALGAGIIGLLCMAPMALASLVIVFKVAGKIGAAYDFGAGKGCLAFVGSALLLGLISSPVTLLVENAFSSWLGTAILSM